MSKHDGRAIEQALAGPTLFDRGVELEGAVVEATYALEQPPLLRRLVESGIPRLIDPQTARFVGARFLEVEQLRGLPYAPAAVIEPGGETNFARLAIGVMRFQQASDATCYVSAALPCGDARSEWWIERNLELLELSCAANGVGDVERRPLIAQLMPGRRLLADPAGVIKRLMDYPIAGIYVQPPRLNPISDGVEKLAQYVQMLLALQRSGLPVIAGRVGAFGLLLQALGIPSFDSGLNQAEAFDLATLNRPLTDSERERRLAGRTGGAGKRVYVEALKTTLPARAVEAIMTDRNIRSHFACALGCCATAGFEDLLQRRGSHYLWVRHDEVAKLRERRTSQMRVEQVHEQLRDAREASQIVRRTLAAKSLPIPSFQHLDRWIGVLGHENLQSASAA